MGESVEFWVRSVLKESFESVFPDEHLIIILLLVNGGHGDTKLNIELRWLVTKEEFGLDFSESGFHLSEDIWNISKNLCELGISLSSVGSWVENVLEDKWGEFLFDKVVTKVSNEGISVPLSHSVSTLLDFVSTVNSADVSED